MPSSHLSGHDGLRWPLSFLLVRTLPATPGSCLHGMRCHPFSFQSKITAQHCRGLGRSDRPLGERSIRPWCTAKRPKGPVLNLEPKTLQHWLPSHSPGILGEANHWGYEGHVHGLLLFGGRCLRHPCLCLDEPNPSSGCLNNIPFKHLDVPDVTPPCTAVNAEEHAANIVALLKVLTLLQDVFELSHLFDCQSSCLDLGTFGCTNASNTALEDRSQNVVLVKVGAQNVLEET